MSEVQQYEGTFSFFDENGDLVELYPDVKTDVDLSTSGKAADAKVVGDKIADIEDSIETHGTKIESLETKINSFEETKSEIVDSGLGTALSMSTNDSWDDIIESLTGVTNNGAWNGSISTSGGSITIPKGYHNGNGKVTGPSFKFLNAIIKCHHENDSSTAFEFPVTSSSDNYYYSVKTNGISYSSNSIRIPEEGYYNIYYSAQWTGDNVNSVNVRIMRNRNGTTTMHIFSVDEVSGLDLWDCAVRSITNRYLYTDEIVTLYMNIPNTEYLIVNFMIYKV